MYAKYWKLKRCLWKNADCMSLTSARTVRNSSGHVVYHSPVLYWDTSNYSHFHLNIVSTDILKTLFVECSHWKLRWFYLQQSFKREGSKIIPDTCSSIAAGLMLADCGVTVLNILASDCFPHHMQLFGAHLQFTYAADESRDIPTVVVQLWDGWNATEKRGAENHLSVGRKKCDKK